MAKIVWEDKVSIVDNQLPRKNKVTAEDMNEIKSSVNELHNQNIVFDFTDADGESSAFVKWYVPKNMKLVDILILRGSADDVGFQVNGAIESTPIDVSINDEIVVGVQNPNGCVVIMHCEL